MELVSYFGTVLVLTLFFTAFLGRFVLLTQIGGLRDSRLLIDTGMLFLSIFSASLLVVPFFFFGPGMTDFLTNAVTMHNDSTNIGSEKEKLVKNIFFSPVFKQRDALRAWKIMVAADSIAILLVTVLTTVFIVVNRKNIPDREPERVPPHTFEFNPAIIEQLNKN